MQKQYQTKITDRKQITSGNTMCKNFLCKGVLLFAIVLFVGCSGSNDKEITAKVTIGQNSPQLQAAVQRLNELFLQVEGKPQRQFTYKLMPPDGGSETNCHWYASGCMNATKPGTYEMEDVLVKTKISSSGESKTERVDVVTRFTTNPENSSRVICYELIRPQGKQNKFEHRGPWDVKLVGSDGIWIGHSANTVGRVKAGSWLSNEWHTIPSGKVQGIRQYFGEPSVTVTETSAKP